VLLDNQRDNLKIKAKRIFFPAIFRVCVLGEPNINEEGSIFPDLVVEMRWFFFPVKTVPVAIRFNNRRGKSRLLVSGMKAPAI